VKEVELQRLIIDVVEEVGGASHKLSNRFLIGIPDLLVKVPGYQAALIEVKLNKFAAPKNKRVKSHVFKLDVTVPQQTILGEYDAAGMTCGVLSGVLIGGNTVRHLHLNFLGLYVCAMNQYKTDVINHTFVGNHEVRNYRITELLQEFLKRE